jgi:hypothetical protein
MSEPHCEPHTVCVLAGCHCSYGFSWGDGFITDPAVINDRRYGLSNPRGYFGADTGSARYRTVLAPHVYGECRWSCCSDLLPQ